MNGVVIGLAHWRKGHGLVCIWNVAVAQVSRVFLSSGASHELCEGGQSPTEVTMIEITYNETQRQPPGGWLVGLEIVKSCVESIPMQCFVTGVCCRINLDLHLYVVYTRTHTRAHILKLPTKSSYKMLALPESCIHFAERMAIYERTFIRQY